MNQQTSTAFQVLTDLYGEPSFFAKPKPGFSKDAFIAEWDDALKKYSPEQVAGACRRLLKFKSVRTFPTLNHVLMELDGEEPAYDFSEKKPERTGGISPITEAVEAKRSEYIQNGFRGRIVFSHTFTKAVNLMLDDVEATMPAEAIGKGMYSALIGLAFINGFWDNIDEYMGKALAE